MSIKCLRAPVCVIGSCVCHVRRSLCFAPRQAGLVLAALMEDGHVWVHEAEDVLAPRVWSLHSKVKVRGTAGMRAGSAAGSGARATRINHAIKPTFSNMPNPACMLLHANAGWALWRVSGPELAAVQRRRAAHAVRGRRATGARVAVCACAQLLAGALAGLRSSASARRLPYLSVSSPVSQRCARLALVVHISLPSRHLTPLYCHCTGWRLAAAGRGAAGLGQRAGRGLGALGAAAGAGRGAAGGGRGSRHAHLQPLGRHRRAAGACVRVSWRACPVT